jgi:hypothetical protein
MGDERISQVVAELASSVGAGLPGRRPSRLRRLLHGLRALARKPESPSKPVVLDTAADKPRDLDDPFSDPDAQSRIGAALAQRRRPRER